MRHTWSMANVGANTSALDHTWKAETQATDVPSLFSMLSPTIRIVTTPFASRAQNSTTTMPVCMAVSTMIMIYCSTSCTLTAFRQCVSTVRMRTKQHKRPHTMMPVNFPRGGKGAGGEDAAYGVDPHRCSVEGSEEDPRRWMALEVQRSWL